MKGRGELLGTGYEANGSTAVVDQVMQRYLESTGVSATETLPMEMQIWVRECKSKTVEEAGIGR